MFGGASRDFTDAFFDPLPADELAAWEVTTKARSGTLPGAGPLAVEFAREVRQQGFQALPISLEHGQVAGSLTGDHRDPFDRMLVAQAREEKMALVSKDLVFDEFGVRRIW